MKMAVKNSSRNTTIIKNFELMRNKQNYVVIDKTNK